MTNWIKLDFKIFASCDFETFRYRGVHKIKHFACERDFYVNEFIRIKLNYWIIELLNGSEMFYIYDFWNRMARNYFKRMISKLLFKIFILWTLTDFWFLRLVLHTQRYFPEFRPVSSDTETMTIQIFGSIFHPRELTFWNSA